MHSRRICVRRAIVFFVVEFRMSVLEEHEFESLGQDMMDLFYAFEVQSHSIARLDSFGWHMIENSKQR